MTLRRLHPAGEPTGAKARGRKSAGEARRTILEAAERRLIEGGPEAIRVQAIARDLGLTDAAIHYHFGSRDGLVEALVRSAGRRLKEQVGQTTRRRKAGAVDLRALIDLIAETYGDRGYARLTAWMALAGWKVRGSGMYREPAEAIHAVRVRRAETRGAPAPALEDTLFAVALLNLVLWAEPLVGSAMRRSVGLAGDGATASRHREWLARLLEEHVSAGAGRQGRHARPAERRPRERGDGRNRGHTLRRR